MDLAKLPTGPRGFAKSKRDSEPAPRPGLLNSLRSFGAYKRAGIQMLNPKPEKCLLMLGFGQGDELIELAGNLNNRTKIVGVDKCSRTIEEARCRAFQRDLSVEFAVGNPEALNFCAGTFDGCLADGILQHVLSPTAMLSELIRVAKPGARIVVTEPDWETLTISSAYQEETRVIVELLVSLLRHRRIARELEKLFKRASLRTLPVTLQSLNLNDFATASAVFHLDHAAALAEKAELLSPASVERWLDEQRTKSAAGEFFASMKALAVCGFKQQD